MQTLTSPRSNLRRDVSQRPHWIQWDASTSPRKLSLPFEDNHPHVIHPSLNRPHSPPQMASRCNQPFCHNTLCRLTDRLTDRQLTLALFYEDQPERMDSTSALWQLCCECYWMHTCRHNFLGSLPCERSKCEN